MPIYLNSKLISAIEMKDHSTEDLMTYASLRSTLECRLNPYFPKVEYFVISDKNKINAIMKVK